MHIIGSGRGVAHYGYVKVWTERGLIMTEDMRTGEYGVMSVREFLKRLKVVNDMVRINLENDDWVSYYDDLHKLQSFVEDALDVVRKAKEFGEPLSEEAAKSAQLRRTIYSRPTKIQVVESVGKTPKDDVAWSLSTKPEKGMATIYEERKKTVFGNAAEGE
jgi:hypothetical protein